MRTRARGSVDMRACMRFSILRAGVAVVTSRRRRRRAGPNTNSSQFFITFAAQHSLDGKHVRTANSLGPGGGAPSPAADVVLLEHSSGADVEQANDVVWQM